MTDSDLGFVHRFVPGTSPPAPLLLLLHGTGGNEDDLLGLGHLLSPGAPLLSPRGKVLERGMPRFFRRLAEGVFDLQDLHLRTDELADFVLAAGAAYGLSNRRVVAVGYSNGANMAVDMLLNRPGILAGAVLFHALLPREQGTTASLGGLPVFLTAGRADRMIDPAATEHLAAVLRQCGADLTLHWEAGGHSLAPAEAEAARDWLAAHYPHPGVREESDA